METAENISDPVWEFEVTARFNGKLFLQASSKEEKVIPWSVAQEQFETILNLAQSSFSKVLADHVGSLFSKGAEE